MAKLCESIRFPLGMANLGFGLKRRKESCKEGIAERVEILGEFYFGIKTDALMGKSVDKAGIMKVKGMYHGSPSAVCGHIQEVSVPPVVIHKLRMEAGGQPMALSDGDYDSIWKLRQYLDSAAYGYDGRGADKNGVKRGCGRRIVILEFWYRKIHLKGIHLAAKSVSLDGHIHQAETRLILSNVAGQENRTCAGPPQRMVLSKLPQWINQS
jgi:hypothetical protein